MPSEIKRPYLFEKLESLAPSSLSLVALSSEDLSSLMVKEKNIGELNYYDAPINAGVPHAIKDAVTVVYKFAHERVQIKKDIPLVVLALSPIYRISEETILNVVNVENMSSEEVTKQIEHLIEDNFGRIQMMVKRFAILQQPHQG